MAGIFFAKLPEGVTMPIFGNDLFEDWDSKDWKKQRRKLKELKLNNNL